MEYSEDFKNMVNAHQGKFIGYGNPNAKILIIVPKISHLKIIIRIIMAYSTMRSLWLYD